MFIEWQWQMEQEEGKKCLLEYITNKFFQDSLLNVSESERAHV
jgi:hypothetical protein